MRKIIINILVLTALFGIICLGCAQKKDIIKLNEQLNVGTNAVEQYVVVKGDTLWDIAGKTNIYNDCFKWPLVYRANVEDISDPDIIEINQTLKISREFSDKDIAEAVVIAKETPPYQKKR